MTEKFFNLKKSPRKSKEGKETFHRFQFTAFLPESFEKYFAEGRSSGSFSSDAFPLRINATVAKYCQNL